MDVLAVRRKLQKYSAISLVCGCIMVLGVLALDWTEFRYGWVLGLLAALFVGLAYGYLGASLLLKRSMEKEGQE